MTFLEHLEELRWTLVRSAAAIAVCMVAAFIARGPVFDGIVLAPMKASFITYRAFCALGHAAGMGDVLCVADLGFSLQNISMSGQFFTHLMVSFAAGLVVAFPFVLWELWRFVAPGLHPAERASLRWVVAFASLLFMAGVALGYFLLAPMSIRFFGGYTVSDAVQNVIALDSYIGMVTSVTLWTGVVFQLPIVVLFLTRAGLITPAFMRTYRRHAFVLVLVLAAIITPPDVLSQLIVSAPLMALYEGSILLSARTLRGMERNRPATPRTTA
ncbi:MAG: twin-arginine translocase subunit TatC [Flavobacteriales bacterium]|jgi:sec-independent protein translocase protein TatC|nr:twin-arginine translocase subunit TatC [Flavobacteriales bacterium]